MPSKTKSFKDSIDPMNPALQFISAPAETLAVRDDKPGKPPDGFKVNPLYIETKSRRLQLLVQPSLYEKLRARAFADSTSVNELVHSLLVEALSHE